MKKLKKDVRGLVGAGVTTGVGSAVVGVLPGTHNVGFGTMGSMLGVVGTATMAKHALRNVEKYKYKTRKRRR